MHEKNSLNIIKKSSLSKVLNKRNLSEKIVKTQKSGGSVKKKKGQKMKNCNRQIWHFLDKENAAKLCNFSKKLQNVFLINSYFC